MLDLPPEVVSQLSAVRGVLQSRLADHLCAIHLFGSTVDGGLKPHSDIDLMVSVTQPLTEQTRCELMQALLRHSAWPGTSATLRALEVTVVALGEVVPWRYPARREMQFGEWLREDILSGRFEPPMFDHDLAILLTKLRNHSTPLLGPPAPELFDSVPASDLRQALKDTCYQWNTAEDWSGDERNVILALARIWYTSCTGDIASKEAAAAWAMERLPTAHRAVMQQARNAYVQGESTEAAWTHDSVAGTIRFCRHQVERELT